MLARTEWPQWSGAIPYDALQAGLLYILLVLFCCLACCDDWEGGRSEDEGLRKSIVILEKNQHICPLKKEKEKKCLKLRK